MKDINEIKKRVEIYYKNKILTFIIEISPSGRETYYNGFINGVKTDMILVYDLKIKKEVPILLDYIKTIEPSRRREDEF